MDYDRIFAMHCKTKQPLMLWGSSGYGKSSIIAAFAERYKLELKVLHAQYLEPLSLFIPAVSSMEQNGYAKYYPSEIVYEILNTEKKTLLFLDELTRAREDTLNLLTEIFLERKIFGYQIPKNIYIFAASNFQDDDIGVRELPDAVMHRLTHIMYCPDHKNSVNHMRSSLAKKILKNEPGILTPAKRTSLLDRLNPCPRQIDVCAQMAEKGLDGEELVEVCRGRIGLEKGTELAFALLNEIKSQTLPLPKIMKEDSLQSVELVEKSGHVLEVVEYLRQQMQSFDRHQHIANYLLLHASPEVCRSMQLNKFEYQLPEAPTKNGRFLLFHKQNGKMVAISKAGRPWQWYAAKIGKLASR